MKENEKILKKEEFMEWTTFIEDRVNEWVLEQNPTIASMLNYRPESLLVVEKYLLENFQKESVGNKENMQAIDALVSYFGETLRRNIPNSIWYIELEDKTSIDYSSPSVKAPIGPLLGLYFLLKRVFAKSSGTFLFELYQKMYSKNS